MNPKKESPREWYGWIMDYVQRMRPELVTSADKLSFKNVYTSIPDLLFHQTYVLRKMAPRLPANSCSALQHDPTNLTNLAHEHLNCWSDLLLIAYLPLACSILSPSRFVPVKNTQATSADFTLFLLPFGRPRGRLPETSWPSGCSDAGRFPRPAAVWFSLPLSRRSLRYLL